MKQILRHLQIIIFIFIVLFSCKNNNKDENPTTRPLPADTLRVVTMYSPTAYFFFQDEFMGFDYELAQNLAKYMNLPIKISLAASEQEMAALLDNGEVDIAAYNVVQTKELKRNLTFVFQQPDSYQILVQKGGDNSLANIGELNGKTVTVKQNSVFAERLKNLNQEFGGGINIVYAPDTITSEDLIELVALDSIDYTLAYYNTALLFKSIYRKLDLSLHVGFYQRNGWLVSNQSIDLQKVIEEWENNKSTRKLINRLRQKYWQRNFQLANEQQIHIPRGSISPYDDYFKEYAKNIGWDWRLVAAVANAESRFKPDLTSWAGAVGVMQLMPVTARKMGLTDSVFYHARENIQAGTKYLKYLERNFSSIEDLTERKKFILASYNVGPAHIFDAIELTKKHGRNPQIWDGNVEYFLIKKNEPEYYNDPVVKYGPLRGASAASFVKKIMNTYDSYSGK
ncbi:MAG: transglycosylase SLT domain-containing protein [Paludibacter sp.]|nr:transglycosylase SLT domain-containing protein [Paludibacter sp.]